MSSSFSRFPKKSIGFLTLKPGPLATFLLRLFIKFVLRPHEEKMLDKFCSKKPFGKKHHQSPTHTNPKIVSFSSQKNIGGNLFLEWYSELMQAYPKAHIVPSNHPSSQNNKPFPEGSCGFSRSSPKGQALFGQRSLADGEMESKMTYIYIYISLTYYTRCWCWFQRLQMDLILPFSLEMRR